MIVTLYLRSPVTLTIKCISFSKEGTVAKLGQQIHFLVKSLSTILRRCWWHNIDMVMWFCLSIIFLLLEELRLPKLERRYTSLKGIADTSLQVLVMPLCQTFQKTSYFNKKVKELKNRTFGFPSQLYTKMFLILS